MRIIDSPGGVYRMADGTFESPKGWYIIIEKVSREISCIFAYKEDEPTTRFAINAKDVVLAPAGDVAPEVLVHPAPSGAHDVHLVEHHGGYSMYRVGNWEGTATLWRDTGRWEISFKGMSSSDKLDGGSVDEHPNTLEGAWAAWSSRHPLLAT